MNDGGWFRLFLFVDGRHGGAEVLGFFSGQG